MSWSARWFNGRDSTVHAATVELLEDQLQVALVDAPVAHLLPIRFPLAEVAVSERFPGAPRRLQLPDGSTLAVEDDAEWGFDLELQRLGRRPGIAGALIRSRQGVVASLLALIALVIWIDRQGAGMLARLAVPAVPISVDQRLGAAAGAMIEARWMAPTQVPEARLQRLQARVKQMVDAQHPDLVWGLAFRNMRDADDAFNAFALPGGTIVLLDGLTEELSDDQLIAVIGHELGHVVHRHTMQRVLRQVGLLAVAGVVLGDVSNLAAATTAGFQDLHYSRDAEREADAFAIEFLRRADVPLRHIADAFEAIRKRETSGGLPAFLSSHPPTEERLRIAREAAAP